MSKPGKSNGSNRSSLFKNFSWQRKILRLFQVLKNKNKKNYIRFLCDGLRYKSLTEDEIPELECQGGNISRF